MEFWDLGGVTGGVGGAVGSFSSWRRLETKRRSSTPRLTRRAAANLVVSGSHNGPGDSTQ